MSKQTEAMKLQTIMEQAQVFASAWSLVGGRFDGGNAMDDAEVAKNELRQMVAEALAEQPAQQEPVAWQVEMFIAGEWVPLGNPQRSKTKAEALASNPALPKEHQRLFPVYTSPPAQRKPLHIGEETAAFKAWFDAWWIGDGEQGETIPTQSDKHFLTYLDQYTLGFGAWMAAKHAAHGIKENT